jgi:DNA-binding transcriptional regulator YiaG
MPSDWDPHYEDGQQEWDTVTFHKKKTNNISTENLPTENRNAVLHTRIHLARLNSKYSPYQLASIIGISLATYEAAESRDNILTSKQISHLKILLKFS